MKRFLLFFILSVALTACGTDNRIAETYEDAAEKAIGDFEEAQSLKDVKKAEEAFWKTIFKAEEEMPEEKAALDSAFRMGDEEILDEMVAIEEAKLKVKLFRNKKKNELQETGQP